MQRFLLRSRRSGLTLRLSVISDSPVRIEDGYHCPEFGVCLDNKAIVIEREGSFPLETRYCIERL